MKIGIAPLAIALLGSATGLNAQQAVPPAQFPKGLLKRADELPSGPFRERLEKLPLAARGRALQWLRSFHFPAADVASMQVDPDGCISYGCGFSHPVQAATESTSPEVAAATLATVPISPFPDHLVFNSRPGAPNVIYLNFSGEDVTATQWNTTLARSVIPALPFSSDTDITTFSDSEQTAIKRVWQRVAEDYALFDVNVTTERPASFNSRTAMALITRSTDANGAANPSSGGGGVAYVNVFGSSTFASYRPAWVYYNNLANNEAYISEAVSHEIGHNLGLSHDGTSTLDYYGGHGSGEISWGPIMGTGYNRNVSQWSKGDYALSNNAQDDLTVIAGKLTYRADDHSGTRASATPLVITAGTNVVSTTPENDTINANPSNKGILERTTDVDIFSFITGNGPVQLSVNPWLMPAGTRGGNLDVQVELYNEAGTLLLSNNDPLKTSALIDTTLTEGRYYLQVRNSAAGTPLVSPPSGYTAYGSLGRYFVNGFITENTGFVSPPLALLESTDLTQPGQATVQFSVTYSNSVAIDVTTIDSNDIRVTGPNGYSQLAALVAVDFTSPGTPRTATYAVTAPGGGNWLPAHNGNYAVSMEAGQVKDSANTAVAAGSLGQFNVSVMMSIYAANMDTDPGWTMEPSWQYGAPAYPGTGPTGGYSGSKILGFNLSGNYANGLSTKLATTPAINTTGSTALTLRFKRWLRTRSNDPTSIEVSADGSTWLNVWSTTNPVSDSAWQSVEYPLPAAVVGSSTLRLRWGLASSQSQNDIGWNIDDVELIGSGAVDTHPPQATLAVADLSLTATSQHPCDVTYTDASAVKLSRLDSTDLLVTGPNGYSQLATFVAADLPTDGTPITGSYTISAPDGIAWHATDNGVYTIALRQGQVEDIHGNVTSASTLGTFTVSIIEASPGSLEVSTAANLVSSGQIGGPFTPASAVYTLTNSGGTAIDWTATKTASWVELSVLGGSLAPGSSTEVTVSFHSSANSLAAGTHTDTVSFTNTTQGNGNTTREVSLTVLRPGELVVESVSELAASGTVGGPFNPGSASYVLSNAGGMTLLWSATMSESWVDLSATSGSLAPGESTTVTVSLNANASTLPAGSYDGTVSFGITSAGGGGSAASSTETRSLVLEVMENLNVGSHRMAESGVFEIIIQGSPGTPVTLEGSTDFSRWTRVTSGEIGENGTLLLMDVESPQFPSRFYRAAIEAP
ncbi:MAG: M12 family metallo-peptidase [Verrucomicrobiota bacterium]